MFEQIPEELRSLKRWICFDISEHRKLPFTPGTNDFAKSDDPGTWRTFEEATADVVVGKRQHLGLVIEKPYVFIDLDEAHPEIEAAFDTYKQRSVSGEGIHIIGRGTFEGDGVHPSAPAVGLFCSKRFCLFTADVVDGNNEIKDLDNDQLQSMRDWLGKDNHVVTTDLVDEEQSKSDEQVLQDCRRRFESFPSLWEGNAGDDHSASDHSLISMLADESDCNEQVRRLFKTSRLCRPHRANDKYINRSLRKTRGNQKRTKDSYFQMENDIEDDHEEIEGFPDIGSRKKIDDLPDGLIKRIAEWHWGQALYPLQECSMAVGITTIATVGGRCYQTMTGSGLNPWVILLAGTSWGKNEYSNGVSGIFGKIDNSAHIGRTNFSRMVGGSAASGEGIEDRLLKSPRLSTYFPEFDKIFRNLTAPNPASHIDSMTKCLLDLYGRSGENSYLIKRFKAKGKDEDETPPVQAPCLVVSGETIPERLYNHMSIENIETGFIQRFSLFESDNDSVSVKMNPNQRTPMPQDLIDDLLEFFTHCEEMTMENKFHTVPADKEAKKLLFDYADKARKRSLSTKEESVKEAYNRAGFKVFKFSALFAVAKNWKNPTITLEHVRWAIASVEHSDEQLISRFRSGMTGSGQVKQEGEILQMLKITLALGTKRRIAIGIPKKVAPYKIMIPQNWLRDRLISNPTFVNDRRGAVASFMSALKQLDDDHKITRIKPDDEAYGRGSGWMIALNV